MRTQPLFLGLVAIGIVGAGSYGAYRFGMSRGMHMTSDSATSAEANAAAGKGAPKAGDGQMTDRKVLYWHDPMVPGQKFDKPGKSPFMDMQLVPVYADAVSTDGTVGISPRVVQNLGIRTAEVVKGSLAQGMQVVGNVAYNERELVLVQARVSGFVEKLHVRAPLDSVRKGQVLVEILAPDWVAAQEEYLTVRRMQAPDVEPLRAAARQRMMLVGMSEDAIRLVESTGKVQTRATYHAPISGVIAELGVREGMTVMPGATLFRINGLGSVWINAEVPEAQAAVLTSGQQINARTQAYPGSVYQGRIAALLPQVSQTTRTITARIELANPGGRLSPGMFMTVDLASGQRKESLLVPSETVIQTGTRSVVMLALGEGRFQPVAVEVGSEANSQTEIRKGLEAGQKVVVSGQFLIDSEASLRGTTTRMEGVPAASNREAGGATHRGRGKVEAIGKDEITLSHGPIASLQWGAMTMPFGVPASGLSKNIAVGDSVDFAFRQTANGQFQLTEIAPLPSRSISNPSPPAPVPSRAPQSGAKGGMKDGMQGMTK